MADDWFRGPDWDAGAREEFERRLARARPRNRAQYLRIKGLGLADGGRVREARELWGRVLADDEHLGRPEQAAALEHLATSYAATEPDRAEALLRQLLHDFPSLNGTTGTAEIALAELLLRRTRPATAEAAALLQAFRDRGASPFPAVLFRWHLAVIEAARQTGDTDTARRSARTALELARQGPVLSRHPTVGVVDADGATLRRLRRLAR